MEVGNKVSFIEEYQEISVKKIMLLRKLKQFCNKMPIWKRIVAPETAR